jgi:hypothetical protein
MHRIKRLNDTPWYFKVFACLVLTDILLSFASLVPFLYQCGFSHLGNIWWAMIFFSFFIPFQDNDRGVKLIKLAVFALAAIRTSQTVSTYRLLLKAHSEFPWHPSFFFYWYHWVDGAVVPWIIALFFLFLPTDALPLRQSEKVAR